MCRLFFFHCVQYVSVQHYPLLSWQIRIHVDLLASTNWKCINLWLQVQVCVDNVPSVSDLANVTRHSQLNFRLQIQMTVIPRLVALIAVWRFARIVFLVLRLGDPPNVVIVRFPLICLCWCCFFGLISCSYALIFL